MKKTIKLAVVPLIMLLVILLLPFTAQTALASSPYMKKASVSWDLKKNKTITVHTRYAGLKTYNNISATMTKYKVTKAQKKGYKKLTFTIVFTHKQNEFTCQDLHSIVNSDYAYYTGDILGNVWVSVLDYKTGKCLEANTSKKIKVKQSDFKYSEEDLYYLNEDDPEECICLPKKISVTTTVTYPASYKNLCIGLGGIVYPYDVEYEPTEFWQGKMTLGKTCFMSKKDKMVAHFMRVR